MDYGTLENDTTRQRFEKAGSVFAGELAQGLNRDTRLMALFLILFVFWAVVHSATASSRFKAWARDRMGVRAYDGTYRLLYNLLAVATFLPVIVAGALVLPHRLLWEIGQPVNFLFVGIQVIGLAGLAISFLQTDFVRFLGVGQLVRYLRGDAHVNQEPLFITTGTYRIVRHPLYFFSLLVLWFTPVMTLSLFLFNIAATIYFWVGSVYEEKRLRLAFGERYEAYCRRVPRLVPIKMPTF